MLTFRFSGAEGVVTEPEVLTAGMVGKILVHILIPMLFPFGVFLRMAAKHAIAAILALESIQLRKDLLR